jgi:hypothetical protein
VILLREYRKYSLVIASREKFSIIAAPITVIVRQKMSRYIPAVIAASMIALTTGCSMVAAPVNGQLFTSVKGPVTVTSNTDATVTGQSCAQSFLGLIAVGDASIGAAKAKANITTVSAVDHQSTNLLGLYAQYCTIVSGK